MRHEAGDEWEPICRLDSGHKGLHVCDVWFYDEHINPNPSPTEPLSEGDFAEAVRVGWIEVTGERDGEPVFRLTAKGTRHVEEHMGAGRPCDCEGGP